MLLRQPIWQHSSEVSDKITSSSSLQLGKETMDPDLELGAASSSGSGLEGSHNDGESAMVSKELLGRNRNVCVMFESCGHYHNPVCLFNNANPLYGSLQKSTGVIGQGLCRPR